MNAPYDANLSSITNSSVPESLLVREICYLFMYFKFERFYDIFFKLIYRYRL